MFHEVSYKYDLNVCRANPGDTVFYRQRLWTCTGILPGGERTFHLQPKR